MNDRQVRFIKLLENIFELDKSDLDFGIYRIMNIRRAEIEKFFKEGLPKKINETLAPFAGADSATIRKRMAEIETSLGGVEVIAQMPAAVPMVAEYNDLKKKLAEGVDISALESDVYSALYSFFSRYYDDGDFISKRRYKEGVYAIPYEGEEVKLYWANQDQYYIKTSENFKDYTFKTNEADGITVHFRLVDATTEQNNNKEADDKKRTFMLYTETEENPDLHTFEYDAEKRELIIRFVYDIPTNTKTKWHEANMKTINAWIAEHPELIGELLRNVSTKSGEFLPIIEKHLKGYVAKNTFDYFIHKDLGGFLRRELDFFIKNEVMHIDDIDTETETRVEAYLGKVRAIKRVGGVIIDFLAQVEDFQKRLWLKKKFVVETNYCITLDKIDERFYGEIAANEAQVKEWIDMYAINEVEGFTATPTIEFMRANQNLIVDTRHFDTSFRDQLLADIDNLDEQTNGVMINADNIHALRILTNRYANSISNIHIDPPYNTDTSGFLYKNNYRHSSWMSMMNERINVSKLLMDCEAPFICHIDENEYENLFNIFKSNNLYNLGSVIWDKRNPMTGGRGIALQHEYMTWFSPSEITISSTSESTRLILEKAKELITIYGCVNEELTKEFRRWISKNEDISGGDAAYNNIDERGRVYQSVSLRAPEPRTDPKFHIPLIHPVTGKPCPMPANGFSRTPETLAAMQERGDIIFGEDETVQPRYKMYLSEDTKKQMTSVITNAIKGKSELMHLGFEFPYCHSTNFYNTILSASTNENGLILDYFAGSGTTGHAVINLNREDGGNRKYILVEMGEYFSKVTQPRIKKVVYASEWKDGKPKSRTTGVSHIMKYMRLESYEDALSNIELKKTGGISLWGEDYLINYMLNMESRDSLLSIDKFRSPFEYKMRITEKNECRERQVDVCETFNYLIGLKVMSQSTTNYYSAEKAASPAYDGAVELRKDDGGLYGFRQIEGVLPDGRKALVIWRTITDNTLASNAALDAYFSKYRINPAEREYDIIYVNGDNNLENLRTDEEQWKVVMIEKEFNEKMWEE